MIYLTDEEQSIMWAALRVFEKDCKERIAIHEKDPESQVTGWCKGYLDNSAEIRKKLIEDGLIVLNSTNRVDNDSFLTGDING